MEDIDRTMVKTIPLTKGMTALVDDQDYEELSHYRWYAHRGKNDVYYAYRDVWHSQEKWKEKIPMHRQLMQEFITKEKYFIDHINHNGLDNRRNNLRSCTNAENMWNCTKHRDSNTPKGVYWDKQRQKWGVQICCHYKKYCLGRFDDLEQAVLAYNKKAKELFGNFTTPITSQEVVRP